MPDRSSSESDDDGPSGEPEGVDGARVLAVALASVRSGGGEGADAAAVEAARRRLRAWTERVGAPESELRRAGRRLAGVVGRLEPRRVRAALSGASPAAMARAFVEECSRWDRDFAWDVPLRDVARAIVAAAARVVRDEMVRAHAAGDISDI